MQNNLLENFATVYFTFAYLLYFKIQKLLIEQYSNVPFFAWDFVKCIHVCYLVLKFFNFLY